MAPGLTLLRRTLAALVLVGAFLPSDMPFIRWLMDRDHFGLPWLWDGDRGYVHAVLFAISTACAVLAATVVSRGFKR